MHTLDGTAVFNDDSYWPGLIQSVSKKKQYDRKEILVMALAWFFNFYIILGLRHLLT